MTIDVGTNLTSLGFTFLALKYLLPLVVGLIIAGAGFFGLRYLLQQLNLDLSNREQLMTVLFLLVVVFALLYNSTH